MVTVYSPFMMLDLLFQVERILPDVEEVYISKIAWNYLYSCLTPKHESYGMKFITIHTLKNRINVYSYE